MEARDKNADLLLLAQEFLRRVEWEGDGYFGLDGKRPWGDSDGGVGGALDIIGVQDYSDEFDQYAYELMQELPAFLRSCTIRPPSSP